MWSSCPIVRGESCRWTKGWKGAKVTTADISLSAYILYQGDLFLEPILYLRDEKLQSSDWKHPLVFSCVYLGCVYISVILPSALVHSRKKVAIASHGEELLPWWSQPFCGWQGLVQLMLQLWLCDEGSRGSLFPQMSALRKRKLPVSLPEVGDQPRSLDQRTLNVLGSWCHWHLIHFSSTRQPKEISKSS